MHTSLKKIRSNHPCKDGWKKLLQHLGKTVADDDPLPILTVLDSNGLDDALWCLRAVDGHEKEMRLFAAWCARQVQHLTDARSIAALDVSEKFALGRAAAGAVAWAVARDAAQAVARAVAWDAAWAVARDDAAWAATGAVAWAVARDAALGAALAAQEEELRKILSETSTATA